MKMNKATLGIILTLSFVAMESGQFVFFGTLFQAISPMLFGFLIFGLTMVLFVGRTLIVNYGQFQKAIAHWRSLVAVNLGAVATFSAYLFSVQLIEPAITYTISAGVMPVTAYVLYRVGFREGEPMRNALETAGAVVIFIGIVFLSIVTVMGLAGFVRGDSLAAFLGVLLAIVDGVFFTLILVYSQRLDSAGVGAGAVLGLRMPLYVLVTGGLVFGTMDATSAIDWPQLMQSLAIGFVLTVPPLYLLQQAVSLVSTLTMSALTALGPFMVFGLQLLEGRVDYAVATLIGLSVYFVGAILSAVGAVRGSVVAHEQKGR